MEEMEVFAVAHVLVQQNAQSESSGRKFLGGFHALDVKMRDVSNTTCGVSMASHYSLKICGSGRNHMLQ